MALYPSFKQNPEVVSKIFDCITVAVPSVISSNISSQNFDHTVNNIFQFLHMYCENNDDKWKEVDSNRTDYEDLIVLMHIVKDALDKLAMSSSDDDDSFEITILDRIGSICKLLTPF